MGLGGFLGVQRGSPLPTAGTGGGKVGGGSCLLRHCPDLAGEPGPSRVCLGSWHLQASLWLAGEALSIPASSGLGKIGLVSSPQTSCLTTGRSLPSFWPPTMATDAVLQPTKSPDLGGEASTCALAELKPFSCCSSLHCPPSTHVSVPPSLLAAGHGRRWLWCPSVP